MAISDRTGGAVEPNDGSDTRLSVGFVTRAALAAIAVWALALLLWAARDLLFVAFFAILVASFLSIFVAPLQNRLGMARGLAAVIVIVGLIAVGVGVFTLAWPALQDQINLVQRRLPEATAEVTAWVQERYRALSGEIGQANAEFREQLRMRINREVAEIVGGAVPLLNTVLGAVAALFIILFAGIYLAVEPRLYADGLTRLVPPHSRARVERALGDAGHALRQWMMGTLISMLVIGTVTTIGLWLLGVPAPFALGVIAGLLEFVPYFGPIVSALPAIGLALLVSPVKALWVVLFYTGLQQVEGNVIYPLIMKGVVELPPALTILVQSLMAVMFGFLGLLLAVPILAAGKVLTDRLYIKPMEETAENQPA